MKLWIAEGFGTGRVRWAPGTVGSVVGLGWTAILLVPGSAWVFVLGSVAGVGVAVWLCGEAERLTGRHDPSSVVLDEIVAMPLCFAALLGTMAVRRGFPGLGGFLEATPWWTVPAVFGAFRLFDVWKPWPVRQSQRLPGGWGVVTDDLLAAGWVNIVVFVGRLVGAG